MALLKTNTGIGITNPSEALHVIGNGLFEGIVSATSFTGNLSGTATSAINLVGGQQGSVPYQSSTNSTTFLSPGSSGQVLLTGGSGQNPYWAPVSSAAGSFGGITIQDEGDVVGSALSISSLNFVGSNITATGSGIAATITIANNLVGTALSISGISTFTNGPVLIGSGTSTGTATQPLQVTGGAYVSGNLGIGTTTPTSKLQVVGDVLVSGIVTATTFNGALTGSITGNAASADKLFTPRTISLTGDVAGSVSFDGSTDVSIASTIQPNSVGLGTDTFGDYVKDITGTSNQITVTSGTGEGSTPTLSIPNQFTVPQDLTVIRDVQINRNLSVNGNITIGGTSATIFSQSLNVFDPDIVLGYRTDANGNDVSNDNTANHGGVAIASTEGSPLVQLFIAGIETNPATYKKIMWFKAGTFAGLGTDAWLSNYAIGIGSTQFPTGTRLAAGSVQFTENDLAVVRNINASGIITATTFVGSFQGNVTTATYATNAGVATNLNGGASGSIPYQYSSGITSFLSGSSNNGWILTYDTATNAPIWSDPSSGVIVGTANYAINAGIATYATNAGIATYATNAGIATYATNAGIATYATNAGIATYAVVAGIATYAVVAGIATYATNAGIATYATNAGIATYATNAGIATYSTNAGIATYATNAGIATYSTNAGIATYATNAGIATYATNAGIATYATNAGIATYSTNAGIATYATNAGIATYATNAGIATYATNAGIATYATNAGISTNVIGGIGSITQLQVTGISTFINGPVLIGSGTSTGTASQPLQVTGGAYVSGSVGIGTTNPTQSLHVQGSARLTGALYDSSNLSGSSGQILSSTESAIQWINASSANVGSANSIAIAADSTNASRHLTFVSTTSGNNVVYVDSDLLYNPSTNSLAINNTSFTGTASQNLQVTGGAYVSGNLGIGTTTPTSKLHIIGDVLVSGVITATTFFGNLTGYASTAGIATYATNAGIATYATNAGIATYATNAGISTNVIGGIGSITQLQVTGISTFTNGPVLVGAATSTGTSAQRLQVTGGTYVSGSVGIGTTNPTSKLQVQGDVSIASTVGIGTVIDIVPYDTLNSGTLSFEGSAGQLFSITNNLTSGSIFSVNDVSGIPSIDVDANGTVSLVAYGGNVAIGSTGLTGTSNQKLQVTGGAYVSGSLGIGTTNPSQSLHVQGNARLTGALYDGSNVAGTSGQILSSTGSAISWINPNTTNVGSANSIAITLDSTNASRYLTFVSTTSGNNVVYVDSDLLYNPSTNSLAINSTSFTGTASQNLQVTGGAYVSGNLGIGTTNPVAKLQVTPTSTGIAGLFSGTTSSDMVRITQLGTGNALVVEGGLKVDDISSGSGKFNVNISRSIVASPTGVLNSVLTFPSTAGKRYIIHSISVANVGRRQPQGAGATVGINTRAGAVTGIITGGVGTGYTAGDVFVSMGTTDLLNRTRGLISIATTSFVGVGTTGDPAYAGITSAIGIVTAVSGGAVIGVALTYNGFGYTSAPVVTFQSPVAGGTLETGTSVLTLGEVTAAYLNVPGEGYTIPPNVSIASTTGIGATITADVDSDGKIIRLNLLNRGYGYSRLNQFGNSEENEVYISLPGLAKTEVGVDVMYRRAPVGTANTIDAYIAFDVPIPVGGVLEVLKQPSVLYPSDAIHIRGLDVYGSGLSNAVDIHIAYEEENTTAFVGVSTALGSTIGLGVSVSTTLLSATTNPILLQSLRLTNTEFVGDYDTSVKIVSDRTIASLASTASASATTFFVSGGINSAVVTTNSIVSIGTFIDKAPITGIGSTSFTISRTTPFSVAAGTGVTFFVLGYDSVYFARNLMIPAYASVELFDMPKRLERYSSLAIETDVVGIDANIASTIDVDLSGKIIY